VDGRENRRPVDEPEAFSSCTHRGTAGPWDISDLLLRHSRIGPFPLINTNPLNEANHRGHAIVQRRHARYGDPPRHGPSRQFSPSGHDEREDENGLGGDEARRDGDAVYLKRRPPARTRDRDDAHGHDEPDHEAAVANGSPTFQAKRQNPIRSMPGPGSIRIRWRRRGNPSSPSSSGSRDDIERTTRARR